MLGALLLTGSPHGEIEPRKTTYVEARSIKSSNLDLTRVINPAATVRISGMSMGF
jgi:hypothetical protein